MVIFKICFTRISVRIIIIINYSSSIEEFKEIFFPIKEDEIVYKINENNTNEKLSTDYNCLKNIKEKKEQVKEKKEINKNNNLVDFTFAKNSNRNSKISIKNKIEYAKSLKKLIFIMILK